MISKLLKLLLIVLYISNCEAFRTQLYELNKETEHLYGSANVSETMKASFPADILRLRRGAGIENKDDKPQTVVRLWPNGHIPVRTKTEYGNLLVNSNIDLVLAIKAVVTYLNNKTCIRFVQKKDFNDDFIEFTDNHDGCFTGTIGNSGGRQTINLGDSSCWNKGRIFHEIMHKLGFLHEHQRNDRDNYVIILHNNLLEEQKDEYKTAEQLGLIINTTGHYDYESIMHNPSHLNGKEMIRCKPDNMDCSWRIMGRTLPSEKDIEKINELYRCSTRSENPAGGELDFPINQDQSGSSTTIHSNFTPNKLTPNGIIIICVIICLGLLVVFILCGLLYREKRKKKKKKKELQELHDKFMNTAIDGQSSLQFLELNPEIPIDQQTEDLPYNIRYETKKESVHVSKILLGEGQFGKVFKGSLTSSVTKEKVPVAVKTPQDGTNLLDQKMLLDELKIMIHIDSNPNVLSLVGAVTKYMVKGELYVITEFCVWGQLGEYIRQREAGFLNEIVLECKTKQKVMFKNYIEQVEMVQICGVNDSNTTVYTSEKDPAWAQEHQDKRSADILTTSDILSYCYQAAKGMDYLVRKNVLHRDLAARNLLLTENQVVKVSDFGLAKNKELYEMRRSQNIPLPIRWMALESIVDQKFTTKSDVWSFGVVLWELFSFGKFPYSEVGKNFKARLIEGLRLGRPLSAPFEIYQLMCQTWLSNPLERPTFADCCGIIGKELERCSKPLFDEINGKLAEEEQQQFDNCLNWRKMETSQPTTPTEFNIYW